MDGEKKVRYFVFQFENQLWGSWTNTWFIEMGKNERLKRVVKNGFKHKINGVIMNDGTLFPSGIQLEEVEKQELPFYL